MRLWDLSTAARVDHFIANSRFIAARIRKCYRRESTVIHASGKRVGGLYCIAD